MRITHCRVNYLENPFIDREPYISWIPESDRRGSRQTAYRITCRRAADGAPVCDTGWVESEDCLPVPLPVEPQPLTEYRFCVRARDERGCEAQPGEGGFTGAMRGRKFEAKWITGQFCDRRENVLGAVWLRREFARPARLKKALLVICGLGYFEARINGKKVGDDFLSTPLTAFDQQVQYRVFDVTEMLGQDENALGVILGNGLYNCFTQDAWATNAAIWRDVPKLLCELHLFDEAGAEAVVRSDTSWLASRGPNTLNGLRHGEYYDARLTQDGWDLPGFTADGWERARLCRAPGGTLSVMEMEPIRVFRRVAPVKKWRTKEGWMLDIGVSQSGVANIRFHGKAGDELTVRYSDLLDKNGEIDQQSLSMFVKNYRFQTDMYTKRTDEPEWWRTKFAYHGFRYLEISGNGWEPELNDVEVWSLCNDFQQRGVFHCSDEMVNRIQQAAVNSSRSMCFSVMASDTTREKISWTGDTGLSCEQMLTNFGTEAFFVKWMRDLRDAQRPSGMLPCIIPTPGWGFTFSNGPDWSNPIYEIPLELYRCCGDTREMDASYDALCRYIGFLDTMANDRIVSYGLGDWCAPFEGAAITKNMESFKCPVAVSDTAYYYAAVCAASLFARLLGRPDDAAAYAAQAEEIRAAFREKFYDTKTLTVAGDCQTATGMMISFGMAEPEEIAPLTQRLVEQIRRDGGKLDFGILGMKAVLNALGRGGYAQMALDLVKGPEYPSIGCWLEQGATTLWECWNGGGSHNHHMFSDVSAFLYKHVAGILPEAPGYKHICFRPMLAGTMESAEASVRTVRGEAACQWKKTERGFEVCVTVPVSCTGRICLPAKWNGCFTAARLTESGVPLNECEMLSLRREGGEVQLTVPCGKWDFKMNA